jgi:spore germination cell wall hydrolase CwlJ-like protein
MPFVPSRQFKQGAKRTTAAALLLTALSLTPSAQAGIAHPPPHAGEGDHRAAMVEGIVASTAQTLRTELRHKRARVNAAVRAFRSNVARLKARYIRMAKLRARIPTKVRQARARNELARMQSRGSIHCLTTAIYHEARYESDRGQRAVAEVILARTRTRGRPKSVCGVVYEGAWRATGCQFSFTCDGLSDGAGDPHQWARAKRTATLALGRKGKDTNARGATFYHASYVKPRWAKRMKRVARIGTHVFYRPR